MKPVPLMAHDASVQRLRRVWRILERCGVEPWLDQGTLLGIVRDGRLIPWDNDIDISCWRPQWQRNEYAVLRALDDAGFPTTVRPALVSVLPQRQTLAVNLSLKMHQGHQVFGEFVEPRHDPLRNGVGRLAYKVRVLRGALGSPGARTSAPWKKLLARLARHAVPPALAVRIERELFRLANNRIPQQIPAHFLDRFTTIEWSGHAWRAPADLEGYLAFKYGPDWRKPRRQYVYYLEDGAIARTHGATPTDPPA